MVPRVLATHYGVLWLMKCMWKLLFLCNNECSPLTDLSIIFLSGCSFILIHIFILSPFSASLEDVLYPEGKSRCESVCFVCVRVCVVVSVCLASTGVARCIHAFLFLFLLSFFHFVASHPFPVSYCLPCIFSCLCNDLCLSCIYLSFVIFAMLYLIISWKEV